MERKCTVEGCDNKHLAKGLCDKHRKRLARRGTLDIPTREPGTGNINQDGYIRIAKNGISKFEHVWIAEEVLGRTLNINEEVHHINENKADNRRENLLICTKEYHTLLHQRMRAMEACGNPNYRKCSRCKHYDNPANMLEKSQSSKRKNPGKYYIHSRTVCREKFGWNKENL